MRLPQLPPMLATTGVPFDSPEYRFEIKWDGVRALAAIDAHGWRLWGREAADYTLRYPEFAVLQRLPAGTLVDGELVVRGPDRPTLAALLRRHHLSDPWQVRLAARWCPVRLVLFDVLYYRGRSLLGEPLHIRCECLAELFANLNVPEVTVTQGIVATTLITMGSATSRTRRRQPTAIVRSLPGGNSTARPGCSTTGRGTTIRSRDDGSVRIRLGSKQRTATYIATFGMARRSQPIRLGSNLPCIGPSITDPCPHLPLQMTQA